MVLDRLAAESAVALATRSKMGRGLGEEPKSIFVKPMTYMNRSGEPLSAIAQFLQNRAGRNADRVRRHGAATWPAADCASNGGTGGHNGLESIIQHFGTDRIPRLRIGIGAAPAHGAVDYVLGRFFEEEKPIVEETDRPRRRGGEMRH